MITFVDFLFGFAAMVVAGAMFSAASIAAWFVAHGLARRFRQGSLNPEA